MAAAAAAGTVRQPGERYWSGEGPAPGGATARGGGGMAGGGAVSVPPPPSSVLSEYPWTIDLLLPPALGQEQQDEQPAQPVRLLLGVSARATEVEDEEAPPMPFALTAADMAPCPYLPPEEEEDGASGGSVDRRGLHPAFLHQLAKAHVLGVDIRTETGDAAPRPPPPLLCLHPSPPGGYDAIVVPDSTATFSVMWGHLRSELWQAPPFSAFLAIGPGLLTRPVPPVLPPGSRPPVSQPTTGHTPSKVVGAGAIAGGGSKRRREEEGGGCRRRKKGDGLHVSTMLPEDDCWAMEGGSPRTPSLVRKSDSPTARDSCIFGRACIRRRTNQCPYRLHPGDEGFVEASRVVCNFGKACRYKKAGHCKNYHPEDHC